jgi:flagellar basal-body rod protein FlgC
MDPVNAIDISAAGMAAQRMRLEAAALNLANMNASSAPGVAGYRPVRAVIHAVPAPFPSLMAAAGAPAVLARAELVPEAAPQPRLAYEPGHPDADANGMVAYPAIDHTAEMLTIVSATRAYEANLAALQVTRSLAARALDIGGGQ